MKKLLEDKRAPWVLGGIAVALVLIAAGLFIHKNGGFEKEQPEASVTEVELSDITDETILSYIAKDVNTPGYYAYESDKGTYVLLTFGETLNLVMDVNPMIDGMSVYFKIGFTEISETNPHLESHIYLTDAEAIGGDEAYLVFPGYGVGASGFNTGWVEKESDGSVYIVPLEETRILDRVAVCEPGVTMNTGFYRYEYAVTTTGVKIRYASELDDYAIWCRVQNIDEEALTCDLSVGDENVVLKASFSEDALSTVQQMASADYAKKVQLQNVDGVPFMMINSAVSQESATALPEGEEVTDNG